MNKVNLIIDDKSTQLPIIEDSYGNRLIDTTKLHEITGCYAFDPAYKNTASCESEICYIGGKYSLLTYRGHEINQLAQTKKFTEVAYLLYYGNLPNNQEHQLFLEELQKYQIIDSSYFEILKSTPRSAHPMSILMTLFGQMSNLNANNLTMSNSDNRKKAMLRIIAKLPVFLAMIHNFKLGKEFKYSPITQGYAYSYLEMLFHKKPSQNAVDALDKIFTLHADHEQNASTSTVRAVGSTGSNTYACISSGIAALWGPLHGGANEQCLHMLKVIKNINHVDEYLKKAADPNDPFRLYGFGHRVYKSYDPRAICLKNLTKKIVEESNQDNHVLDIALHLEEKASKHAYFIDRNLHPNVDFYSGIIQSALGLDEEMFTTTFVLGRTIGWISHLEELITKYPHAICRPRQRYLGPLDKKSE